MIRFMTRSLLAAVFISGGINQLKSPDKLAPVVDRARQTYGVEISADSQRLVAWNGAGMVAAGGTLALGIAPKLSAAALISLLVPTTIVGHPFWSKDKPAERSRSLSSFLANVAIMGGLLAIITSPKR